MKLPAAVSRERAAGLLRSVNARLPEALRTVKLGTLGASDSHLATMWKQPELRAAVEHEIRTGVLFATPEVADRFFVTFERELKRGASDDEILHSLREVVDPVRDATLVAMAARDRDRPQTRAERTGENVAGYIDGTPRQVLDIGAGDGAITEEIARHLRAKSPDVDVAAVDVASEYTHDDQRGFSRLHLEPGATTLPAADDSVSAVTMLMVLHHMEDPKAMLSEAYRVLEPGGRLVIRDHDASTPQHVTYGAVFDRLMYRTFFPVDGVSISTDHRPMADWVSLAEQDGFEVVTVARDRGQPMIAPTYAVLQKPQTPVGLPAADDRSPGDLYSA